MFIETASGHTIFADDEDADLLSQFGWYTVQVKTGRRYAHARVRGTGKRISMHRLLMQPPPGLIVNHDDNNGLNNRRKNLQVTTQRVNTRHARSMGGVHPQDGRWRAQVRDENGKRISLGMYDTEERARAVVQNWNYQKMIELESVNGFEARDLAAVIGRNLTIDEEALTKSP